MLTENLLPVTDLGLITDGEVVTGFNRCYNNYTTSTYKRKLYKCSYSSSDGNVLVYDGTANEWKAGVVTSYGGAVNTGVTTFKALSTPANYTGRAGKYLKINPGETGVEYDALTTDDVTEGTAKFYTDPKI